MIPVSGYIKKNIQFILFFFVSFVFLWFFFWNHEAFQDHWFQLSAHKWGAYSDRRVEAKKALSTCTGIAWPQLADRQKIPPLDLKSGAPKSFSPSAHDIGIQCRRVKTHFMPSKSHHRTPQITIYKMIYITQACKVKGSQDRQVYNTETLLCG